jgi:hypothetical protein
MSKEANEATVDHDDTGKPEDDGAAARLTAIKAQRHAVSRAQRLVDECTEELKEAKGGLGRATLRLLNEIDDDQMPLEFPEKKNPEAWTTELIEDVLALPSGLAGKLKEAEIETLGQLATHSKTKGLTDIEGIGDSGREKIEAALEDYWARAGMVATVGADGEPATVGAPA